ncbi:MAG: acetate--CoA ligase family protein [Burkholderiales bacterium]|nr:acetate--CoA ligase family protein [Burkholderiales bacterium]
MSSLDKIMKPRTMAVIGASNKPHTIGHDLMKNLVKYGFTGTLYPVHPKDKVIHGLPAYHSVLDIPGEVDMAVIVINAKYALGAVDECAQKGIKGIVVITAGFKETGPAGAELEKQLVEKIHKYGMTCVGPNCMGVVNTDPAYKLDATFAETLPERGTIGFVSQSGALGGGILNILKDLNIGFSQFISIGNQADVNSDSAIEFWKDEKDVKQILLYMESIPEPKLFRKLATETTKKKPIVALKAGRSAAGASAASSHTGSLAGADKAADALLKQSGVIREFSLEDLFNTARVFSNCPLPKGDRVAIITNSGGPGIMSTDAVIEYGMQMAPISDETKAKLREFLPSAASVKNPIDMIASAPLEHYQKTLETVLADPSVDMIVCIYLPFLGLKDIDVAKAVMEIKAKHPEKPIIGVFMTKQEFFKEISEMKDVNIPVFEFGEQAVAGLRRLNQQRIWESEPLGKVPHFDVKADDVKKVIEGAIKDGRDQLTTAESIQVLADYGIRVCKDGEAKTEQEAVDIANKIGYPVVMKMNSKTISHKTDVGGVRVGIQNAEQLKAEYEDLIAKLKAKGLLEGLESVIIQEMVTGTREMLCGCATDPQYGQLMVFGLGGVYVEVMQDVCFRLAPLTDQDACSMIKSVKAYKLLEGARGAVPAKMDQVKDTLLRLSQLVTDFGYIEELDINPLMISDKDGEPIAVDGRIKVNLEKAKAALNA